MTCNLQMEVLDSQNMSAAGFPQLLDRKPLHQYAPKEVQACYDAHFSSWLLKHAFPSFLA